MLLPKGAYYATSNPNRDFYFFSLSFLKVCFHAILNKSKDIVFHVNSPPPAFYLPLIDFRLQSLAISPCYQAAAFSLAYASSIVLGNSFRKHSAIIFQYIFFSNLNMVVRSSNSCFCLYTEEPCLATTPFIQPPCLTSRSLSTQTWKSSSHFIILKTSSMRPPRYITTRILWPNAGRINVNIPKVGSAGRLTHLVQSPFCNGRVSLLAGPKFLRRHFTRFPFNKNSCLEFRKNHLPSGRYIPVAQTKPKPPRVWLSCL